MSTVFTVCIGNAPPVKFDSAEAAARFWDSSTYALSNGVFGGIGVQEFSGDLMVRDGWLIHVQPNGVVYVSPSAFTVRPN